MRRRRSRARAPNPRAPGVAGSGTGAAETVSMSTSFPRSGLNPASEASYTFVKGAKIAAQPRANRLRERRDRRILENGGTRNAFAPPAATKALRLFFSASVDEIAAEVARPADESDREKKKQHVTNSFRLPPRAPSDEPRHQ